MSIKNGSLNTRDGFLWVQPNGPNTQVYPLGCHDLGDLVEPSGSITLTRCMDKKKGGWKTVGSTQAPPDAISTSIDSLTFEQRDWLEKLKCDFNLYVANRAGGEADIFDNYVRMLILNNARITSATYKGIVMREEEADSEQSRDIEAWPPLIKTGTLVARRQETSETLALNDVYSFSPLDCENRIDVGDKVIATADGSSYSGNVLETINAGIDWAALAADPFATGKNIMSGVAVPISDTVTRYIVAQEATGGQQGKIAYSDDRGVSWTVVNIGGAAAGHGAVDSGALFALDQGHVWLVSALGYIYFSYDGGVSWTAQTSGGLTVKNGHSIAFQDENYGLAGFADDIILYTTNGGETWSLTAAVTGTGNDVNTVSASGDFWWLGMEGGTMWYSRDLGVTWTQRAFTGSGVGDITDMAWANDCVGFALHNSAAPVGTILVTVNGGYSWKAIQTPTNTGLNALTVADVTTVYAVGEVEGGTAVIIKVTWD